MPWQVPQTPAVFVPGLLSFRVAGGHEGARAVLHALRTITCAVSLGAVDTLIEHPAGITHRILDEHARADTHITEDLLRLSVGLEDPADLWADLEQALGTVRPPAGQTVGRSGGQTVGRSDGDRMSGC